VSPSSRGLWGGDALHWKLPLCAVGAHLQRRRVRKGGGVLQPHVVRVRVVAQLGPRRGHGEPRRGGGSSRRLQAPRPADSSIRHPTPASATPACAARGSDPRRGAGSGVLGGRGNPLGGARGEPAQRAGRVVAVAAVVLEASVHRARRVLDDATSCRQPAPHSKEGQRREFGNVFVPPLCVCARGPTSVGVACKPEL
jgi:hypothetical protein